MIRLLCALSALCVPAASRADHPYDAVCRVVVQKTPRRPVGGSGVLIGVSGGKALILTAAHVAIEPGLPASCDWAGQVTRGRVLRVAPDTDAALLLVARPDGVYAVSVAMPSKQTGPFVCAGYPGYDRGTLRIQTGEYAGLNRGTLTVTCRPEPGMSGGAVFDRHGRVVGAVSAYDVWQNLGYAGSGPAMLDLVDDYLKGAK